MKLRVPDRFRHLAPVETEMTRLGINADGGYVVPIESVRKSDGLVSLGISSEWSFDAEFLKIQKEARYIACDRSSGFLVNFYSFLHSLLRKRDLSNGIPALRSAFRFLRFCPPTSNRKTFIRKWVRGKVVDEAREICIDDLINRMENTRNIFLKIDIEGAEYEILPSVIKIHSEDKERFTCLCIEFHEIGSREEEFLNLIEQLLQHFDIVHMHANNCGGISQDFPNVLEITLVPTLSSSENRVGFLPRAGLHFPNCPELDDITLEF